MCEHGRSRARDNKITDHPETDSQSDCVHRHVPPSDQCTSEQMLRALDAPCKNAAMSLRTHKLYTITRPAARLLRPYVFW